MLADWSIDIKVTSRNQQVQARYNQVGPGQALQHTRDAEVVPRYCATCQAGGEHTGGGRPGMNWPTSAPLIWYTIVISTSTSALTWTLAVAWVDDDETDEEQLKASPRGFAQQRRAGGASAQLRVDGQSDGRPHYEHKPIKKERKKSKGGVNEMGMQIRVCDYRFIKSAEEWLRQVWFTFKNSTVEKLNILAGWDDNGQVYRSVNLLLWQDKLILLTLTRYIPNQRQNKCLGSPGEDQICNSKACEDKK